MDSQKDLRRPFAVSEIVWRKKEQFDEGSGTVDALATSVAALMPAAGVEAYRGQYPEARLRSAEECYYHKLFMEVFDNPEIMLPNVGRWAERPVSIN